MELFIFTPIETVLLLIASTTFCIQALYYFCIYNRIYLRNRASKREEIHFSQEQPPVSVIIYVREEYENLRRNLISILSQAYPQFEVIVINDGKDTKSEDYLTLLENNYTNLYHSFVPDSSRYISRKKLAITLGIKAAKYDWIVVTDANCRPASDQWLSLLARNFTSRTQVVLGYSGYETGKGWLHKRAVFDNLFTSMRYLGFALAGKPYMGIGRNLAYRKDLFYNQKGFSAHLDLQRGDDDLFINQVATATNTRVETTAEAAMLIPAPARIKEWKEEKIGYANTARLYQGIQRYLLGFETTDRIIFYVAWIGTAILSVLNFHWIVTTIALLLFLLRYTFQAIIINFTARSLSTPRRYYLTLPLFDFLQPCQSLRWKLYCLFRKKEEFLRK